MPAPFQALYGPWGLIGQSMSGAKPPVTALQAPFFFPPGNYNFSPPVGGRWKFIAWGSGAPGDGGSVTGCSGSYLEKTAILTTATVVVIAVSSAISALPLNNTATTINIPGQPLCTAGSAIPGSLGAAVGVATGGDVNLNGATGAVSGGGTGGGAANASQAGAPGMLPFIGGRGGFAPGGAGAVPGGSAVGVGLVIVFQVG